PDAISTGDLFAGRDLGQPRTTSRTSGIGFLGQKNDSVLIAGSWSGRAGPVRALVQGNVMLGHAKGANADGIAQAGLTGVRGPDRDSDIFTGGGGGAGGADLGVDRALVGALWGFADRSPAG